MRDLLDEAYQLQVSFGYVWVSVDGSIQPAYAGFNARTHCGRLSQTLCACKFRMYTQELPNTPSRPDGGRKFWAITCWNGDVIVLWCHPERSKNNWIVHRTIVGNEQQTQRDIDKRILKKEAEGYTFLSNATLTEIDGVITLV